MKSVFYLKDEFEFYQTVEEEIICWVYRWTANGHQNTAYSVELRNLIEENYNLN